MKTGHAERGVRQEICIQFEDFADCIAWWNRREENSRAWRVSAEELRANSCNLDRKNPNAKEGIAHIPPAELAAGILTKERQIAAIMEGITAFLAKSEP